MTEAAAMFVIRHISRRQAEMLIETGTKQRNTFSRQQRRSYREK